MILLPEERKNMRILLIEDDPQIGDGLYRGLHVHCWITSSVEVAVARMRPSTSVSFAST